jgi:F-type H+-transporting ATPase subunit b
MTIDWWTLGFQTVNVLVLMWLLSHFFWRPLSAMIEQRRVATQHAIDAAAAKDAKATAALEDIAKTRAGFEAERGSIMDAAHTEAETQHTARLDQAQTEATALTEAAGKQAAKDATEAERAWTGRAGNLAVDIAGRLLAPLDGPALRGVFLGRLVEQIRALPQAEREGIAPGGAALTAVSAEPLDAAEQESSRTAIVAALESQPAVTFEVDPALIAGLELHGPHAVVGNSLRTDLDRVLLELTHDGH